MEQATRLFQMIQNELTAQNEQLNKLVENVNAEMKQLEEKFNIAKQYNTSSEEEKRMVDDIVKFNQELYNIRHSELLLKKTYYQNEIKKIELYFSRCSLFMSYMSAKENGNEIQVTQSFYSFINHVYEEFIKRYKSEKDYYLERKNIHENYILLLSLHPSIDSDRRSKIERRLLPEEDYELVIKKIAILDEMLNYYKEIFKTKKPRITKKSMDSNICFNYDIANVVANIYPGVKKITEIVDVGETKKNAL